MIFMAAVVVSLVAIFGLSATQVALRDLAVLETQQAAQRAAEAAAAVSADAVLDENPAASVLGSSAADGIARANVHRGSIVAVTTNITSTTGGELVHVRVTVRTSYGGIAGPFATSFTAGAAVPQPP